MRNSALPTGFGEGGRVAARAAEQRLLGSDRDWCTQSEAAKQTRRSRVTIAAAIAAGDLQAEKVGRHVRIPNAALAAWDAAKPAAAKPRRPKPDLRRERRAQVKRLHELEYGVGKIATALGWSKNTVRAELDALGLRTRGATPRVLSSTLRAQRRERAAERYRTGQSLSQIAAQEDSSPTQVRRDLGSLQVEMRPGGHHAEGPSPAKRFCAYSECAKEFTPDYSCLRGRLYHTDKCARDARAQAGRAALAARGLLGTGEVAERLDVSAGRVHDYIASGLLPAELVDYPGAIRPLHGVRPEELPRFEREWDRGMDPRRRIWLDEPDYVIARSERDGSMAELSENDRAAIVRARVYKRRRRLAKHRGGRKPSPPPHYHWHWAQRFQVLKRELLEVYERDRANGLDVTRPTDWQVAEAVAEEDWQAHPDRWSRDSYPPGPEDESAMCRADVRSAADRVRTALKRLKRLQSARTATAAA